MALRTKILLYIDASKMEEATEFYTNALGAVKVSDNYTTGGARHLEFKAFETSFVLTDHRYSNLSMEGPIMLNVKYSDFQHYKQKLLEGGGTSREFKESLEEKCLANPLSAQYGGGIVVNPELNNGSKGWFAFGGGRLETRKSEVGSNPFIVSSRKHHQTHQGFISQRFYLEIGMLYTFSAWLRVSDGTGEVDVMLKSPKEVVRVGSVVAKSGCWSMIKTGFSVNVSGHSHLYFKSNNRETEIWADSISLQPFSQEQWMSHRDNTIEKTRKSLTRFQAVNKKGKPIENATITITQMKPEFPLGCTISNKVLTNKAYRDWFVSRFKFTTFENEMKWLFNEKIRNKTNFIKADKMLIFAKKHHVSVRGHNVFWENPKLQPSWFTTLPVDKFRKAVDGRIHSLVKRYAGRLLAWDAINENLHYHFYGTKLGNNANAILLNKINKVDPKTVLFINDYGTIENERDHPVTPDRYIRKIREVRDGGYHGPLGIGLEGHFTGAPNLAFMRAALDKLGATGLPIWLTEVDVTGHNQAQNLDQILREAHAHPKVSGIIIWAAWNPDVNPGTCYRMCLTDDNFRNLPTGDVVDKIIWDWGKEPAVGPTDAEGYFEVGLFHGDYEVTVMHPDMKNGSVTKTIKVTSSDLTNVPGPSHDHLISLYV
ncbi:endo-1,4-beta-xylanase 5-like [Impatiens glandulifera]|uniref:endo-1,4-beta-xylanase 5-like n=1 Tax=Impatiens glandulifera TaxID=253017 RepID=UPI001FB16586|nr:endo-1,4-beta-xylanase 5-like [Impatiens glandulifera]